MGAHLDQDRQGSGPAAGHSKAKAGSYSRVIGLPLGQQASPGPQCSSCWSQSRVPTQTLPTAPAVPPAALHMGGQGETGVKYPPNPTTLPALIALCLTLQQLPQLLGIWPLLRVLHQGIGHPGQVAHVALPWATPGPV